MPVIDCGGTDGGDNDGESCEYGLIVVRFLYVGIKVVRFVW